MLFLRQCIVCVCVSADKMTTIPDLDEEIDFLQSVIDKQQVIEGNQASESHRH